MTELIWKDKYNSEGKKNAPVRIALPFQTIETVNESKADRERRLGTMFAGKKNDTTWYNRLIWGDKKYVLPSLLPEFAGKVNLIYIDPPFNTGANFSFTTTIPDSDEALTKQPSIIEEKAYRDTWGKGLEDIEVTHKDEAAYNWCENATKLTSKDWKYIKVPQNTFDKFEWVKFSEIVAVVNTNI
ncbi:MAG: hypothetical protein LBO69_04675 [Ignavibacteria bacterium]|jgi:adenine specific DNA methylase Mod|nr:hypothetical protein [Ignavibacteria bacterium]